MTPPRAAPRHEGANGFALSWLRLRERFDHAARDPGLTRRFAAALPRRARLLDLAAGSGANVRYLAPRLASAQDWLLVDNDAALLAAQEAELANGLWRTERLCLDIVAGFDLLSLSEFDGVAAAALIDLVSRAWLGRLVAAVAAARLPLLVALTVDARVAWQPQAPADTLIAVAFARHQTGDKGFGPALGGGAAPLLAALLADRGYAVEAANSDWSIGAGETAMLAAMIDQFAGAATAAQPDAAATIAAWADLRHRQAADGSLALVVGHRDVLGLPPG